MVVLDGGASAFLNLGVCHRLLLSVCEVVTPGPGCYNVYSEPSAHLEARREGRVVQPDNWVTRTLTWRRGCRWMDTVCKIS